MIPNKVKPTIICSILIGALAFSCNPVFARQAAATPARPNSPSVIGTWRGESICVGDHPACKNEEVVYRFETVPGKPGIVTLLADKIIDGKRIPMYKLEFQYDEANARLSCEFTRRQTHGLWQYKISGDKLEGTLVLLPDESVARSVKVRRVGEDQVPAPPGRELYAVINSIDQPSACMTFCEFWLA